MAKQKGKKPPVIIDGIDTTALTREKVDIFAAKIQEQFEREREERNYFQVERDKLRTFWEVTKFELEESRAKLRNKDVQIEEENKIRDLNLKFDEQQIQHSLYEHQQDITKSKEELETCLEKCHKNHIHKENKLLEKRLEMKEHSNEESRIHENEIKTLKTEQKNELDKLAKFYADKKKQTELKYEEKFITLRNELEFKQRMECKEVTERKRNRINEITKFHDASYSVLKSFCNEMTLNNLNLIHKLHVQTEILRQQNLQMEDQAAFLISENKKLTQPLNQALLDVKEFERQLHNYNKDKISLANTRRMLFDTKKELNELKQENQNLEERFEKLQDDSHTLKQMFKNQITNIHQSLNGKNVLTCEELKVFEKKHQDVIMNEQKLIHKSTYLKSQKEKMQNLLQEKNSIIQNLQLQVATLCRAHDDLLQIYEEKLKFYGVPENKLGYAPLKYIPRGQGGRSCAPVSLITRNK